MLKKNKLLIVCLSLLLVLSVGYALFSETITINGTATAKGSFDITATCQVGYSDEFLTAIEETPGNNDMDQKGFENSICNVRGNMVTMTTDLLYPQATRIFTVKMANTGSIPALIWGSSDGGLVESLDIESNASWALKNKETNEVIKSGSGAHIDGLIIGRYTSQLITIIKSSTGNINSDENVIYNSSREYAGIKLNVGDSVYMIFYFEYPYYANEIMSDNGKTEYFEFKINHEFKWEQYTDNPNYESTTFDEWRFIG